MTHHTGSHYTPGYGYPPAPVPSRPGFSGLTVVLVASGTLLSGCFGGFIIGSVSGSTAAAPSERTTLPRASKAAVPTHKSTQPQAAEAEGEPRKPRPGDFQLSVKTLKQSCFSSAGCLITFRVVPSYRGPALGDQQYTVTYKVTGGKEPKIGSFTMVGAQLSYDRQDFLSTNSSADRLAAEVTEVL